VSTFPTLIKYNFGISWQSNKGRKKWEAQIGKEKFKLSLLYITWP
jgi:hypothetical protein